MPGSINYRLVFLVFTIAASIFFSGCYSDQEPTYVDFSKRVAVEQPADRSSRSTQLRVAVAAMISAKETVVHYHHLLDYIAGKLEREIQLIQRKTYGEINELIGAGQIDLAFICSGPYATGKEKFGFKALATPQVRGKHHYRSYLIVNKDSGFHNLEDLRGKLFAFTDPDSNTGKLVPTYWLAQQGEKPEYFFRKTIYTYSHDNSIMAVATSMVDAATVHEQIWEYYNDNNPIFTSKTRIIKKSEPFGNPLVVASAPLPEKLKERTRQVLLNMHRDPEGKRILDELMIDRFLAPKEEWYDSVVAMEKTCNEITQP